MLKTISKISKKISTKLNHRVEKEHSGQIIALGGGGFSDSPDNLLLDEYILAQSNKTKPKILFLPTAGGDHDDYIAKYYNAYRKLNCTPIHLSLSKKAFPYKRLEQIVLSQDIIFVGGGSPRFLMQVWRKLGMDKILKKAWQQGIILSGMSAGAICWYEDGFTNPKDDLWRRIGCLGFLEGSFCPHYDNRGELRKAYRKMISGSVISAGYGVQDGAALHYIGTELKRIITSVPGAHALYVKKSGFRVTEKEIKAEYIGKINDKLVNKNPDDSANIVSEYVKRINKHDVEGMMKMMSDDHEFIDSLGINIHGRSNMKMAWDVLLTFFPDYEISIREVISKNGKVALFGTAKGTLATDGKILDENKFEIPASWTAIVKDSKITKWRVYADNGPVRKLINKYERLI
jgi:dipeptidase E